MKTTWILITSILFLSLLNFAIEQDIIEAAKAGDAVRVKSLLEINPELVKMTDDGIRATALHWAAMYGRKDVARVILAYNPDVNNEEAHAGTTMHWAAHYDDAEVIGWLLDNGAEIDHKNRYERTPMLVAARRGCKEVVEYLIEQGADISAMIKDGSTALHIAAANGHSNVVESLLARGADASIKNDRNETYKDVLFMRPETTTINTDILDEYAGLYERQGGQTMDIRKENNRLYYYAYGKDELLPISESYFISHAELGYFTFLRNEEEKVTELIYKIGNSEYRAKKIKSYSYLSSSSDPIEQTQGKNAETDVKVFQQTSHPGDEIEPQWSPDDTQISYGAVRGDNQNLGVVNLKTSEEEFVTEGLTFLHATSWSPDGKMIAYVTGTQDQDGFISHVYIVSLRNKKNQQLTTAQHIDGSPSWSPDAELIAFPSNRNGHWNIWIKPVSGGAPEMITDHPALDHGPEWSPNGAYLAFHSYRSGNSDIWMIDLSSRELCQVTDEEADDFYPDWSPDGRYIVFESNRSGNSDIWIKSKAGGKSIQITANPARDMRPSWSNDGTKIAFSSNRNGSLDLWVADISELWNRIKNN